MAVTDIREFYAQAGPLTEPGGFRPTLDDLPGDIEELCSAVQGMLLHLYWASAYGVELTDARRQEAHLRSAQAIFARLLELDPRPLSEPRPPKKRVVGTCRDFTLLLCAILRHRGVPARARCGFASYFRRESFEDHWLCEYWDDSRGGWRRVDAQLDPLQREALKIEFDPLDVPEDQFLIAGRAWELCQAGQEDANRFGIADMHGLWFIRGNVVRDFASLNRVEMLPWDVWGILQRLGEDDRCSARDLALLNRVAELTQGVDDHLTDLRDLYESEAELKVPDTVWNAELQTEESVVNTP